MKKLIIAIIGLGVLVPNAKSQISDQSLGGAIIGGIAGGIIGHNNGRRGWEGALIGTGAGLLAGQTLGGNRRSYGHPYYPHRTTGHYCPPVRVVPMSTARIGVVDPYGRPIRTRPIIIRHTIIIQPEPYYASPYGGYRVTY